MLLGYLHKCETKKVFFIVPFDPLIIKGFSIKTDINYLQRFLTDLMKSYKAAH